MNTLNPYTSTNWLPKHSGNPAYMEHINDLIKKINEIITDDTTDNASLSGDNTFAGSNTFTENIQFAAGAYGVTALAGGGQTGATPLTGFYNTVATVATAGDSCKLPAAAAGQMMIVAVAENTAAAMDLFPATGGKINGGTANAAISMAPGTIAFCSCDVAGNWVVKLVYQKASPFKYLAYKASAAVITKTTSGVLVVGKTYVIVALETGDDFANVGYTSEGTPFVATGTTPTVWTAGTEVFNLTDLPTITTYASNFNGAITVGYSIGAANVLPTIVSVGEFTANLYNCDLTYVDENTLESGLAGLQTSITRFEVYP